MNEKLLRSLIDSAAQPLTQYNPIYFYGSGAAVTAALRAVANRSKACAPMRKIICTSGTAFLETFLHAVRTNSIHKMQAAFQSADLLIIDNFDALCGKDAAQWEFFSLFDALYGWNKQIVIGASAPPQVLPNLENRVRTQLSGGVICFAELCTSDTPAAIDGTPEHL